MAVTSADLVILKATSMASSDDGSQVVGGASTATAVDSTVDTDVLWRTVANEGGGAKVYRNAKVFWINKSGSNNLTGVAAWLSWTSVAGNSLWIKYGAAADSLKYSNSTAAGWTGPLNGDDQANSVSCASLASTSNVIGLWVRLAVAAGATPVNDKAVGLRIRGVSD